jgi:hypothetical protein
VNSCVWYKHTRAHNVYACALACPCVWLSALACLSLYLSLNLSVYQLIACLICQSAYISLFICLSICLSQTDIRRLRYLYNKPRRLEGEDDGVRRKWEERREGTSRRRPLRRARSRSSCIRTLSHPPCRAQQPHLGVREGRRRKRGGKDGRREGSEDDRWWRRQIHD